MKVSLLFLIAIILLFLGCFILAVDTAVAQDAYLGAIHGRVFDPNGNGLPGVRVLVRQPSRGIELTTVADETGTFFLDLLRPGEYDVSAEASGMARRASKNVSVEVGAVAEIEFRMTVARAEEQVTVSESAQIVDTPRRLTTCR